MLREPTLAEKLLRLRGDRPQKEAAELAGIRPATLCRLERGARGVVQTTHGASLRAETLRKLAAFYQVLPEYLMADLPTYMRSWAVTTLSDPSLTSPGQRLRRIADELETRYWISRSELAEALKVGRGDLKNHEEDALPTSPSLLKKLSDVTAIPPGWVDRPTSTAAWNEGDYATAVSIAIAGQVPPEVLETFLRGWIKSNGRKR